MTVDPEANVRATTGALKNLSRACASVVSRARNEIRDLDARWDTPADVKTEGRKRIRAEATRKLDEFALNRNLYRIQVEAFAAERAHLPALGDTATEMRRERAIRNLEAALAVEAQTSGRVAKFQDIMANAERTSDLLMLEAGREVGRALQLRGAEIPQALIDHLDRTAGPPETRTALDLLEEASNAADAAAITDGQARTALGHPTDRECLLRGATFDSNSFQIDEWAPVKGRVAMPGAVQIHKAADGTEHVEVH